MNKILKTSLSLALVTFIASCGSSNSDSSSSTQTSTKKENKTFVFAQGAGVTSFDPAKGTDFDTLNVETAIFDTLVSYSKDGKIIPNIADKWEFTNGGKTLTVHIKKGLKFGKTEYWNKEDDLTADDVVYSLRRQYDKSNKFYQKDHTGFVYWDAVGFGSILKSVSKVDKFTIKFELNQALVPFLHYLTMGFTSIASKDYAENLYKTNKYNDMNLKPVGSASFVFKERKQDAYIKLTKNSDSYHPGHVDSLIFKVIKDNATRAAALQAGDIDAMIGINVEDLPTLKKDANLSVHIQAAPSTGYISFNMSKKPFNNLKVRKALSLAIDQEAIIKNVYKDTGKAANNLYPDSLIGVPDLPPFKQDITKAKQLLKEAGYPNGFETTFWYMPVARPYMPDGKKVAQIIQSDLAKVGVKVKLITYDWATYLQKGQGGEADIFMIGWNADIPDPDNFLYVLFSGQHGKLKTPTNNYSFFMNEEFDTLLDKARIELDENKRKAMYEKANQIIRDEMPAYPIAFSNIIYASKKSVKELNFLVNSLFDYSKVEK